MPGFTSSCIGWREPIVGSGVSEGKSVTEGVTVGVSVGVWLGVKVGVKVAGHGVVRGPTESPPALLVGVRGGRNPHGSSVRDGVSVGVELGVGDGVIVEDGVMLNIIVGVRVAVRVDDGVLVGVTEGVSVGVRDGVGVNVVSVGSNGSVLVAVRLDVTLGP